MWPKRYKHTLPEADLCFRCVREPIRTTLPWQLNKPTFANTCSMGDPAARDFNAVLDFSQTFAFRNFKVSTNPLEPEFSDIDATTAHSRFFQQHRKADVFTLFDFSAKWDPVPTMLCQNHESVINGFMGLTTAYYKQFIKPGVLVLGENKTLGSAKYIHGKLGKGTWTFYGGTRP
jgi:hypothetical protein